MTSIRSRLFAILSVLVMISLAGVALSFWMTQRVNHALSEINLRSVPMQKNLAQLASDTELLKREMDRSLGFTHWNDSRWRPKRIPLWALAVHRSTLNRFQASDLNSTPWKDWHARLMKINEQLGIGAEELYLKLQDRSFDQAANLYPEWVKWVDLLQKEVLWAKKEIDLETQQAFRNTQEWVNKLRQLLKVLVTVVVALALIMIWVGERALRPIASLRYLIQQVIERGVLTPEVRSALPLFSPSKRDEVSELAREFHQMATSLLEREKTIEFQKSRLEEQNKLLTQMGELQQRLQQAEHFAGVGRLSAQVAHEVGNPLHSIGLEAELALDVVTDSSWSNSGNNSGNSDTALMTVKSSLRSIMVSVERLQKIIQNYLKLSRLSPGTEKIIDLKELLENTLATYASLIQKLGVKVDWTFSEEVLSTYADPELLEYAFGNLFRNALQAIENSPVKWIGVTLFKNDDRIHLIFSDSGSGISEQVQSELFKPFFTTKAKGTGLGLSLVKKVFQDLGGEFKLKTSTVGQGTVFEGVLPFQDSKKQNESEARSASHENFNC